MCVTRSRPGATPRARAAGDEPAHRVAHQRDPLHRPVQALDQRPELGAVLGDRAARVVADVHRGPARQVADSPRRARSRRARGPRRGRSAARLADPLAARISIASGLSGRVQLVADQPVQRGQHGRRRLQRQQRGGAQPAADGRVGATRDRVVPDAHRGGRRAERPEHPAGDREVHVADPARERGELRRRQLAQHGHEPSATTAEPVATSRSSGSVTRTSTNTRLRPRLLTTPTAVRSCPRAAAT